MVNICLYRKTRRFLERASENKIKKKKMEKMKNKKRSLLKYSVFHIFSIKSASQIRGGWLVNTG